MIVAAEFVRIIALRTEGVCALSLFYRRYGKGFLDVVAATCVLLILLPLFGLLAVLVRVKLGSPVFFRQRRPGRNSKPFTLVKFRSMRDARNAQGDLLSDEERLTDFGRFLRATSADELPELWNVLKRDISLVGPRPLLVEYLPLYSREQARRHDVRPGLTGWAQVNGRNTLSWEEKFLLDVWYVDHLSFALDLRIMAMSVLRLATRRGISEPGHATASKFVGKQ